jgi:hypothetical protein
VLKEKSLLEKIITSYDYINDGVQENIELALMAEEEEDESVIQQVQQELKNIAIIAEK